MADFLDGNFKWLEDIIFCNLENISIPFSSEHVDEATNIKLPNDIDTKTEIDRRLNYLSRITLNLYLVNDMKETGYRIEAPSSVFQTLNDVPLSIDLNKTFSSFIDYDTLKDGREKLGLDPNLMNNINPEDAIPKIDEIITSKDEIQEHIKNKNLDISFMGILKKALEISEESHSNTSYNDVIRKKKTYQLNNLVVMSSLIPHQKKQKTPLEFKNQYDRMYLSGANYHQNQTPTEVNILWHKEFYLSSMKKRKPTQR